MKSSVKIPGYIYTDQFLRFVTVYTKQFKNDKGYGRWLAEYDRMETRGWLKPEKLRELYVNRLKGSTELSFIYWGVVHYICVQAEDATKAYISSKSFDIRVITGEIAANDDDEELTDLSLKEALSICKAMNDEAEELLFRVYNSITNTPI